VIGDIRDLKTVERTMQGVDAVFHVCPGGLTCWERAFDESKLKALSPESFYTEPPGVRQFAQTGDEPVILQITGVAPTGTQYVQAPAR
jgi:hypothetical protein